MRRPIAWRRPPIVTDWSYVQRPGVSREASTRGKAGATVVAEAGGAGRAGEGDCAPAHGACRKSSDRTPWRIPVIAAPGIGVWRTYCSSGAGAAQALQVVEPHEHVARLGSI